MKKCVYIRDVIGNINAFGPVVSLVGKMRLPQLCEWEEKDNTCWDPEPAITQAVGDGSQEYYAQDTLPHQIVGYSLLKWVTGVQKKKDCCDPKKEYIAKKVWLYF